MHWLFDRNMAMNKENDMDFTEQELVSPVPVGVVGKRTGPSRPSSNDCSAPPVGNQAGGLASASGTDSKIKPIMRRELIKRTPPKCRPHSWARGEQEQRSVTSVNKESTTGTGINLTFNLDPEDHSAKRRRGTITPDRSTTTQGAKIRKLTESLLDEAIMLCQSIKEQPNTKRSIKERANIVKSIAEQLMSNRLQSWLTDAEVRDRTEVCDINSLTKPVEDKCVQTEVEAPIKSKEDRDITRELTDHLRGDVQWSQAREIINWDWPESCFNRTKIMFGNPMMAQEKIDVAVLMDPLEDAKCGLTKRMMESHTEIKHLIEAQKPAAGKIAYLAYNTKIVEEDSEIEQERSENFIFIVGLNERMKKEGREETYEALRRLKAVAQTKGRKRLAILMLPNDERVPLRNMVECALQNSSIEATIYKSKSLGMPVTETNSGTEEWQLKKGKKKKLYKSTVIVKAGMESQKSYAEILSDMKREINIEEIGVRVQAVGKTKEGAIRINIVGQKEGDGSAFQKAVEDKMREAVVVNILPERKSVIITDMDEETTLEELRDTIIASTGLKDTEIEIQALRKNKKNKQGTTIVLPKDSAENLLANGKVRVGWASCRVLDKVRPIRCYKCQGFGHLAGHCRNKDMSMTGKCIKCGREGHIARDCPNEAHCYECKVEGHRADSVACPKYKEALHKIKSRTKGRQPNSKYD